MEEANRLGMMEVNMMEIGAKVLLTESDKFNIQMATNTKANSKMVKATDSVVTYTRMVKSMLDTGKMTTKMVLAEKNYKMDRFSLAFSLKV